MDMQSQIEQAHREMRMIKRSKFPSWSFYTFRWMFKVPLMYQPNWPIAHSFWFKSFKQYHIMTNVPGPAVPVKFGGIEAFSYHVMPPSSPGKASMAIGLISYAGDFSIAVTVDKVPEFDHLPEGICQSFEEVAKEFVDEAKRRLASKKEATAEAPKEPTEKLTTDKPKETLEKPEEIVAEKPKDVTENPIQAIPEPKIEPDTEAPGTIEKST